MDPRALAAMIDHTLLAPEATSSDVTRLCAEAVELGVGTVCVSPSHVAFAYGLLPATIQVASVVGFPSGAHRSEVKALEAGLALENGAIEIDMVINLAHVLSGNWRGVEDDVAEVRAAVHRPAVLKVIIESGALTDDQIVQTCKSAVAAGADFVKTSTGFHKAGGATTHAVALMRSTVGPSIGVKASGGIRTLADALLMIEAGANRIGASASRAILDAAQTEQN
ncbi:MAG: deoxyribose-phosphate aldolase [Actinobacteria bacterium]|nr:deoxyribose-phosphate aldolase [Actinomycetota bacterium]